MGALVLVTGWRKGHTRLAHGRFSYTSPEVFEAAVVNQGKSGTVRLHNEAVVTSCSPPVNDQFIVPSGPLEEGL